MLNLSCIAYVYIFLTKVPAWPCYAESFFHPATVVCHFPPPSLLCMWTVNWVGYISAISEATWNDKVTIVYKLCSWCTHSHTHTHTHTHTQEVVWTAVDFHCSSLVLWFVLDDRRWLFAILDWHDGKEVQNNFKWKVKMSRVYFSSDTCSMGRGTFLPLRKSHTFF